MSGPPHWMMPSGNSHSTEVEHRLTVGEEAQSAAQEAIDDHERRIGMLERVVYGLMYGGATLATTKSGDLAEALLTLLKVARP